MPDLLQRVLGLLGSALTAPLVAALALAVRLDTAGPVIYSARRIGQGGDEFTCYKLRTMRPDSDAAGAITGAADGRITRIGRLLRRFHLDELPQLWNVARGEMRFVGPRPEDPRFVDMAQPLHRLVFTAKPGITGLAQLLHADEAERIAGGDPEQIYREQILPGKLEIDAAYLRHRSTSLDLWIMAQTPRAVMGRRIRLPAWLRAEFPDGVAAHAREAFHA
jgi:lipopolysaccharide/colanic/teichoic acid biosynthesis glycosyltransferase